MDFMNAFTPDNVAFLLEGFWVTLKVAFISIILSFLIGGVVGTLRFAKIPFVITYSSSSSRSSQEPTITFNYFLYVLCPSRDSYQA